jgi:hypothetical protein
MVEEIARKLHSGYQSGYHSGYSGYQRAVLYPLSISLGLHIYSGYHSGYQWLFSHYDEFKNDIIFALRCILTKLERVQNKFKNDIIFAPQCILRRQTDILRENIVVSALVSAVVSAQIAESAMVSALRICCSAKRTRILKNSAVSAVVSAVVSALRIHCSRAKIM